MFNRCLTGAEHMRITCSTTRDLVLVLNLSGSLGSLGLIKVRKVGKCKVSYYASERHKK